MLEQLTQIWAPKIFFVGFTLSFNIVASYHHIQFQEKLMIQTQENDEKLHFELDLDPLNPNSVA